MNRFYPYVTIVMPIRNEEIYIERSLGAVLRQDYLPGRLEILIVDGMSTDTTREIIRRMIKDKREDTNSRCPIVMLIDNPDRFVTKALNIGVQQASGEVIILVGGHCEIAPNYVQRCVEVLQATEAECVGGPMMTVGETWIARTIALAQSTFFGVGGVAFRTGRAKPGYVDTVAFGAYRREIFEAIGGFDEELVRNQDDEFNFRLTQSGGKIWLDPSIRSVYYSRASLSGLWKQYFQYGYYKVRVIQKRGTVPSWRHLVPALFVIGLIVSFLLGIIWHPLWLLSVAGPYLLVNFIASLWVAWNDLFRPLPLVFAILHFSYGIGFLKGMWAFCLFCNHKKTESDK
jgi:succinoglycan biosynthesis protein ExoA